MQSFKDMLEDAIHRLLPKFCLCSGEGKKKWFLKAEEWFNEKKGEWIFCLRISVMPYDLIAQNLRKG